jgi:hypothetical protein
LVTFGDCRQAATLAQAYAARSFSDKRPVLGIPGTEWTTATLEQALRWARDCLDAARARGDVVPPQATVERDLGQFAASATEGITRRRTREDKERVVAEFLDTPAQFPGGEPITCRALIAIDRMAQRLMGNADTKSLLQYNRVLGKTLQEMTENDISLLERMTIACRDSGTKLQEQGLLTSDATVGRLDFRKWRSMVLLAEANAQREANLRDPAKRATIEAQEKTRQIATKEAQIRGDLEGKPTRPPSEGASERVIYCGGFFMTPRAIDGLVAADLAPSGSESIERAFNFDLAARVWLSNREQVIGPELVQSTLMPIYYAGQSKGLTADVELATQMYSFCKAAKEALERELAAKARK